MSKIQLFKNDQFGEIRTMTDEQGEPWFVGKDVAKALGYSNCNDALARHVDKEDKGVVNHDTLGGKQTMTIINESGLYSLILSSKLPSAKAFKRWITAEVLPQIRKTGAYGVQPMSDIEILSRAILISDAQIKALTLQVEALAPRAEYADEVLDSVSCLTTTQIAKELKLTANELNHWLCEQGIQYGQSGQYLLYADYARRGFAQNRSHSSRDCCGELHTRTYLVWTERGRNFIHSQMKQHTGMLSASPRGMLTGDTEPGKVKMPMCEMTTTTSVETTIKTPL